MCSNGPRHRRYRNPSRRRPRRGAPPAEARLVAVCLAAACTHGTAHAAGPRSGAAAKLRTGVAGTQTAAAPAPSRPIGLTRDFNWAYAAAYGTGRYELGRGNTITIARLALHRRLHEPDSGRGCRCGITLLLPVTIGVQNLDLQDLPHRADELGFFPGVELELPRTPRWTLKVTAQAGAGTRKDGARERARLYGAGLRSRYRWNGTPGRPAFIGGLYWSGYETDGGELHTLARFSTGAEFDVPVPRWTFHDATMRFIPHVLADWYFDPVDVQPILRGDTAPRRVRLEWEVGLAAGRDRPFSLLGAKFDRVGLALRVSHHSRGLRLYFGSIF